MSAPTALERDLQQLAGDLRRLEAEYTQYFAGRTPRPPLALRTRVQALARRLDRVAFEQVAQRFRFQTLQARYSTFAELWDRSMRQREEGRGRVPTTETPVVVEPLPMASSPEGLVTEAAIVDPARESERLHDLYRVLCDARRHAGESAIPFQTFVEVVTSQVEKFRNEGDGPVTFRVVTADGKVRFTARASKKMGK